MDLEDPVETTIEDSDKTTTHIKRHHKTPKWDLIKKKKKKRKNFLNVKQATKSRQINFKIKRKSQKPTPDIPRQKLKTNLELKWIQRPQSKSRGNLNRKHRPPLARLEEYIRTPVISERPGGTFKLPQTHSMQSFHHNSHLWKWIKSPVLRDQQNPY